MTAREWLMDNGYQDIVTLIDTVMTGWKIKRTKTRRNWWDVLAGGKDGRQLTIEGVTFPVLKAAQLRKGVPITNNAICRNEAECAPKARISNRWAQTLQTPEL